MTSALRWMGIIVALCSPAADQLPQRPQPPTIEPKAAALLREVERFTLAVRTLSAHVNIVRSLSGKTVKSAGWARVMRPNYARVTVLGKQGQTVAANGKRLWLYNASTNQFVTRTTEKDGKKISHSFGPLIPLAMFFDPTTLTASVPAGTRIRMEPGIQRNGVPLQVIAMLSPQMDIRLYVGPDRLVHGSTAASNREGSSGSIDVQLTGIKLNQSMTEASFAYRLPRGASEMPGSIDIKVSAPSGKQNMP